MGAMMRQQKCGCYSMEHDGRWGPQELWACDNPECEYRALFMEHPRARLMDEGRQYNFIPEKGVPNAS